MVVFPLIVWEKLNANIIWTLVCICLHIFFPISQLTASSKCLQISWQASWFHNNFMAYHNVLHHVSAFLNRQVMWVNLFFLLFSFFLPGVSKTEHINSKHGQISLFYVWIFKVILWWLTVGVCVLLISSTVLFHKILQSHGLSLTLASVVPNDHSPIYGLLIRTSEACKVTDKVCL